MFSLNSCKLMQTDSFHHYKVFLSYANMFSTGNDVTRASESLHAKAEIKSFIEYFRKIIPSFFEVLL